VRDETGEKVAELELKLRSVTAELETHTGALRLVATEASRGRAESRDSAEAHASVLRTLQVCICVDIYIYVSG